MKLTASTFAFPMVSRTVIVVPFGSALRVSVATNILLVEPAATVTFDVSPLVAVKPPEYPDSDA